MTLPFVMMVGLAVRALFDAQGVPVLNRVLVGAELEVAADGLEVRLQHRGPECLGIVDLAA